jgi:four helix bundle protein
MDFRKLRVYRLAVRLAAYLYAHTRKLPADARPIGRQMLKSAASIALNIAEGSGEYAPLEKARFYRYAKRSATETIAGLDMLFAMRLLGPDMFARADAALEEITAMLTTMAKNQEVAGNRAKAPAEKVSATQGVSDEKSPALPVTSSPSPSPSPSP